MIKDDGFFGYARTGEVNGFTYPGVMKVGKGEEVFSLGDGISILDENLQKKIVYPDSLNYKDSIRYFLTDSFAVIPNAIELAQRPSRLVERIWEVRKEVGYGKLIYAQGISDPYLIPILVYAGVQLFDNSYTTAESLQGISYTIFGKIRSKENQQAGNMEFLEHEMSMLASAIRNGTLREIVEKFGMSSKALEILRILDRTYYGDVETVFPVRTPYIKANSIESLERPDLRRYREKLISEFRKPDNFEVALILPCSARKPYSTSRSHQAILSRIVDLRKYIHEIIVTSPVGLVPRELEEMYPARFYDIPVIGQWYEEEKRMMRDLTSKYFQMNRYGRVIAYIPEDLEFLLPSLPEGTELITGGIPQLKESLRRAVETSGSTKVRDRRLETYITMAQFQFGNWIGQYLEGTKIMNSYNQDMLVKKGDILLVYNKELGKFTINKHSAPFFMEHGKFIVEIDNFKPTSNIYAVGVLDATSDIRPEDEIVLAHKGEVRGVGISKMPFQAMKELKKGVAVKVRN